MCADITDALLLNLKKNYHLHLTNGKRDTLNVFTRAFLHKLKQITR